MRPPPRLVSATLRGFAAPIIWFGCFVLVYGSESVMCTRAGASGHMLLVITTSLISILALLLLIRTNWLHATVSGEQRSTERFLGRTGIALSALNLVAVIWIMIPAIILQPCMPPA